jgi:hypothetical protein
LIPLLLLKDYFQRFILGSSEQVQFIAVYPKTVQTNKHEEYLKKKKITPLPQQEGNSNEFGVRGGTH